jgi:hypothetical protein
MREVDDPKKTPLREKGLVVRKAQLSHPSSIVSDSPHLLRRMEVCDSGKEKGQEDSQKDGQEKETLE